MNNIVRLPLYLDNNNMLYFNMTDEILVELKTLFILYQKMNSFDPTRDYRNNMIKTAISDLDLESLNETSLIESLSAIICNKIKTKNQQTALNLLNMLESGLLDKYNFLTDSYIIEIWSNLTYKNRNYDSFRIGYRKSGVNVSKVGKNPFVRKVVYSAPDYHKVPLMMNNLITFANSYKLNIGDFENAILKSAVLSAYFVYIHPFLDGNGRTSRLLMNKFLIDNGLNKFRYLSINSEISKNKTFYNRLLQEIEITNTGDITEYILYILGMFHSLFERVANPNRRKLDFSDLSDREKNMLKIIRASSVGISVKDYKKIWNSIAKENKYEKISIKVAEQDLTHLFRLDFIVIDERYTLYPGFKYYNK